MIIPLFLVAGQAWRTLAGMGISICVLSFASTILFGIDIWYRFIQKIPLMYHLLKNGILQMHQVASAVGALIMMGLPFPAAIGIHMLLSVIGIIVTATSWYRHDPGYIKYSLLVLTIVLVTPYANSYDLTLLALPICWLGWQAYERDEISPLGSFYLIAAWFLPILSVISSAYMGVQFAPFLILMMLLWIHKLPQRCSL
jgi:hypothetical protein